MKANKIYLDKVRGKKARLFKVPFQMRKFESRLQAIKRRNFHESKMGYFSPMMWEIKE